MSFSALAPVPWGLYGRLSDNPEGTKTGIGRQLEDGDVAAETKGGTVAERYIEDDTSAYKQKPVKRTDPLGNEYIAYRVIRPVWAQALHDLRTGAIKVLWVWDLDRLARDNRDLEDAIEVVVHYGGVVLDGTGTVDLMTDEGRVMARMLVAMANKASAAAAKRSQRWHAEQRKNGRSMGGARAFGWCDDKTTIRQDEAALIRAAYEDIVLRGRGIHSIAVEWGEMLITTPRGSIMRRSFVNEVMTNPRLAGYRRYQGEIIGKGDWQPILTEDEWERLAARLTPKRRPGGNNRKYLYSGWLRCGRCFSNLTAYARKPGVHVYGCRARADGGCGGLSRDGRRLDAYLTELVFQWYENNRTKLSTMSKPWHREAELATLIAEMDDIRSQARTRKGASLALLLNRLDEVDEQVGDLQKERTQYLVATTPMADLPTNLREEWADLSFEYKRELIGRALVVCVIKPTGRGALFDPRMLEPTMQVGSP